MRDVPPMKNIDSPPYLSMSSWNFSAMVAYASSHEMRTQPGSVSPLGFVRFKGWYRRSGWYAAWMDDCDFVQQFPMEWNAVSASPSTLMARPSLTVTSTPHSFFPHARQQVRTTFTSDDADAPPSPVSARAWCGAVASPAAAPTTAASFTKLRRVKSDVAILPPSLVLNDPPPSH